MIRSLTARVVLACCVAAGFAACSSGTTTLNPQPTSNSTDVTFVNGAGMSSNSEINDAKLAIAKSSNPDVISFAQRMITDHTAENTALVPVGTVIGDPPPTGVGPAMQATSNTLMTLTGTAFDATYINSEVNGHTSNLNGNYIPELQLGFNAAVKGYASTYKPQIQTHLELAQSIKAKYGF